MYNVIIVDDETWIIKLIRKIVDWETLGFNIIADASDGQTALELIHDKKPDLVITDIRMPSLDGIGLIKATRELGIDSEFIIISGYSDFEYARCAVTYDAFGYLLKPLGKKEFVDVLERVSERMGSKRTLEKKIKDSDTRMLENDIKLVISGAGKDVLASDLNAQYGTNFEAGKFCAAIFKQDFFGRQTMETYDNSDYLRYLAEMKERFAPMFQEMVFFSGSADDRALLIINTKDIDDDAAKSVLQDILKECASRPAFSEVFKLTASIGPRVNTLHEVSASYDAAAQALKARCELGQWRVIDAAAQAPRMMKVRNAVPVRDAKKLSGLFDVMDTNDAAGQISQILEKAHGDHPDNVIIYHLAAYEIIDLLFASMEKKGLHRRDGAPTRAKAAAGVDNSVSKAQIETHIAHLFGEFAVLHAQDKSSGGDQLIDEIKTFITDNYMSEISLDDVAKRVCLNPTYVSEVFKKKTGENFSEYLIGYRINIAKDLLKDVRYKIVDVSQMVGYRDSKYFSRLFKKKVGVNPTNYRKLYV